MLGGDLAAQQGVPTFMTSHQSSAGQASDGCLQAALAFKHQRPDFRQQRRLFAMGHQIVLRRQDDHLAADQAGAYAGNGHNLTGPSTHCLNRLRNESGDKEEREGRGVLACTRETSHINAENRQPQLGTQACRPCAQLSTGHIQDILATLRRALGTRGNFCDMMLNLLHKSTCKYLRNA